MSLLLAYALGAPRGFLGSIISGALGFLGARDTNNTNAQMASNQQAVDIQQAALNREWQEGQSAKQMAFQADQVQQQMAFQERMAGTAHQREIADLKAAGLNPILSGTGGKGADSPSGASAGGAMGGGALGKGARAHMENAAQSGINSAMAHAQIKNLKEQNENIEADTDLKKTQRIATSAQWNLTQEQTRRTEWESKMLEYSAKGAKTEGEIDESTYGAVMRYINRANPFSNSAGNIFRLFKQ